MEISKWYASGMNIPTFVSVSLFSVLCFQGAGCGSKQPAAPPLKTFSAAGKVVTSDGQPVTGGMVQFESTTDKRMSVTSDIKPDGTFSLMTRLNEQKSPGAAEGTYQATVFPPMSASQTDVPHVLKETFKVEPKDNTFTLTVPKSKS